MNFDLDVADERAAANPAERRPVADQEGGGRHAPRGLSVNPRWPPGSAPAAKRSSRPRTIDLAARRGLPERRRSSAKSGRKPAHRTTIEGSIFLAAPRTNPFGTLLALYIVAKAPDAGSMVKLAGKVEPNPVTGQLTTTFENNPQLPFSHFNVHFREGQQAPLVSPPACGTYTTRGDTAPWSEPRATLPASLARSRSPAGSAAGRARAAARRRSHRRCSAGTVNNNAGGVQPVRPPHHAQRRRTGDHRASPRAAAGLDARICPGSRSVPTRRSRWRKKTGAQEEAEPSCPAASQIGHTLVGAGVGASLAYGPRARSISRARTTVRRSRSSRSPRRRSARSTSGRSSCAWRWRSTPYRAMSRVDAAASEPIPHIIDGIVIHVRDIRVYIDRPAFT